MIIRAYRSADEDASMAWWRDCGMRRWSDLGKDIARKMLVKPEWFLGGERDGRVVATCRAGHEGHGGWINPPAAAPGWQGGGPGRAPRAEAEQILRGVGWAKINPPVKVPNTEGARILCEAGFRAGSVGEPGPATGAGVRA